MNFRVFILSLIVIVPLVGNAQQWKRYRWQTIYGAGAANFLGDLGGANQIGTNYFRDLEFLTTRPALTAGMRYKITQQTAIKANLTWGLISGNDKLTDEVNRNSRNLNFYSHVVELSTSYEFYFRKEKRGHRFKLRGVRGIRSQGIYPYGFFGIAGFWFNPQGRDENNRWTPLRNIGTEGQFVSPARSPYSRFQIAIPIGLGINYALDRRWLIGLEYGIRKTWTDYMDDVSTTYYPNDQIRENAGDSEAFLADPSQGGWAGAESFSQRGDPTDNDTYMFLMITVNYKLRTTRGGLPKFR